MIKKFDRVSLLERVKTLEQQTEELRFKNNELENRVNDIAEVANNTSYDLITTISLLNAATKRIIEMEQNRNSDW